MRKANADLQGGWTQGPGLYDTPHVLGGVAELTTSDACAQAEVADTDRVVFDLVGEVILTFSHCSDKHADTFFFS